MSCPAQPQKTLRDIYGLFVAGLFSSISLSDVICAILTDADHVVTRLHPLGFTHAELTSLAGAPDGERFRFHVWLGDTEGRDNLGDLHEHTWDLTSLVLAGSVMDTTLRASRNSLGRYQGSRIIYGERNSSQLIGRFNLEPLESRRVEPGAVYTIPSRTVHLNEVGSKPTVTLVRSIEDNLGYGPLVFNSLNENALSPTSVRSEVNTGDVLRELILALRDEKPRARE